ncbi:MAG: triphosphoribosyl-dephospho-CoA synthase [Oscillospiraceae bacterium]|jgi:triphosphoribosyl-dephospho-CoA synthase|nr:triphosphoribosyl-dephospho-CoA synthase [Oscillospiraceae bacterium]
MTLTQQVASLALSALEEEVRTTPKPGLVDLHDSGAHRDMDFRTFLLSAQAVAPYLGEMFHVAAGWEGSPPSLFTRIRQIGVAAESAMLRATGGVNTHRGAIFTLGILSAGAGQCLRREGALTAGRILELSQDMVAQPLREELRAMEGRAPVTHGERLYAVTGHPGVRGVAIAGFPSLRHTALPALAEGGQPDRNSLCLHVLLKLMTVVEDTTVLHRAGQGGLEWMRTQALAFLTTWPLLTAPAMEELSLLNREFIAQNISPGGCADLLSAALFLEGLEKLSDF